MEFQAGSVSINLQLVMSVLRNKHKQTKRPGETQLLSCPPLFRVSGPLTAHILHFLRAEVNP